MFYQSIIQPSKAIYIGDLYNLNTQLFDNGSVSFEGMISTLKDSIYFGDKNTTVSPIHRNELLSEEFS